MSSSSSSILATKILVISSGVILIAMTMKMTIIPWLISFTESELPRIWSFLVSLCKPPYLYVVINGIIITIAASSRFARTETETEWSSDHSLISAKPPPGIEIQHDMLVGAAHAVEEVVMVHANKVLNVKNPVMEKVEEQEDDETVKERVEEPIDTEQHQQLELVLPVRGNLRALSRFGPPKSSKLGPQGKREVIIEESSKKSEEVTLESMWKTIMEGREEPLEQSIKKSDAIKEYTQKVVEDESKWRATSFMGGASYLSESPIKSWILKKEPTLGQDELNRRADEFIHKFNEEMRMQRQQSLNQNISNTIARGAY